MFLFRENVRVLSFGLFVLFVYPGAFVELNTDQLEIATPVRKLRIFTAGVWHNFVLAIAALLFSSSLPYMLRPFYTLNEGVVVTWISQVNYNPPFVYIEVTLHAQLNPILDHYIIWTIHEFHFGNSKKFGQLTQK